MTARLLRGLDQTSGQRRDGPGRAQSIRADTLRRYHTFFNRWHHLFPKVAIRRLKELAAKLDRDLLGSAARRRTVTGLLDGTSQK
ncbi:hypothetical protein [Paracoccus albus]|uniref:hypothetical protein n=1 Tax=Paracoccus albus TaxID=3017784 RepID=UPI0022F0C19A|nr:hypothetical protein [Paracoccus albus]WBU60548.1 hypothetical protein PAF20_01060 [Paracoccus albus]